MKYVVTAANGRFRTAIDFWKHCVERLGLTPVIYDMGGLGIGTDVQQYLTQTVSGFGNLKEGVYEVLEGVWKSKGLHKPWIIKRAMADLGEPFLYLDADAFLRGVPKRMEGSWDIGVTVRPKAEWGSPTDVTAKYRGKINTGVVWVSNTPNAAHFVDLWCGLTTDNDQIVLNRLCQDVRVGETVKQIYTTGVADVRGFPGELYNSPVPDKGVVIVHLKNDRWQHGSLANACGTERIRRVNRPKHGPIRSFFFGQEYITDIIRDPVFAIDDDAVQLAEKFAELYTAINIGDITIIEESDEPSETGLIFEIADSQVEAEESIHAEDYAGES